jgi:hypothetical protein
VKVVNVDFCPPAPVETVSNELVEITKSAAVDSDGVELGGGGVVTTLLELVDVGGGVDEVVEVGGSDVVDVKVELDDVLIIVLEVVEVGGMDDEEDEDELVVVELLACRLASEYTFDARLASSSAKASIAC